MSCPKNYFKEKIPVIRKADPPSGGSPLGLSYEGHGHPTVNIENISRRFIEVSSDKSKTRVGYIVRQDDLVEQCTFSIVCGQLLYSYSVSFSSSFGPSSGPDVTIRYYCIRIHYVHADFCSSEFGRVQAAQVELCSLSTAISGIVGPAYQRVFADNINDVATDILRF